MFWIILGTGLMIIAFILAVLIERNIIDISFILISVMVAMFGAAIFTAEVQEKVTAIEALQGNNPYEMKILYEKGDTIAYDTIYIKK